MERDEATLQGLWEALCSSDGAERSSLALATALHRRLKVDDPAILLLGYGLFCDLQDAHVCWTLAQIPARLTAVLRRDLDQEVERATCAIDWAHRLQQSPAAGNEDADTPIIVDEGLASPRVYLHKMHRAERFVAQGIEQRLGQGGIGLPSTLAKRHLGQLFAACEGEEPDPQCVGAVSALCSRFAVLAGGPGTGKTYSVVNFLLLAQLSAQHQGIAPLDILLLAPTGKAAMRLSESVLRAKSKLALHQDLAAALEHVPTQAHTLHRALEIGWTGAPRRSRHAPLSADLVVVDESSMVDLVLMAQLMDALAPKAQLLLVGDAAQLASVQAGAVLGDLCGGHRRWQPSAAWRAAILDTMAGRPPATSVPSSLLDVTVHLQTSRRFAGDRGIGKLANAVLAGDEDACMALLVDGKDPQIEWHELGPRDHRTGFASWIARLQQGYASYLQAKGPKARLEAGEEFQVLCATKKGPLGVAAANELMWAHFGQAGQRTGQRILITRNDTGTGLVNGDVGVIETGPKGELRAFFPGEQQLRAHGLSRLPAHELAFAMSIHKSQGSEYDTVMVVLPDHAGALATRELLYTGITRAKRKVIVLASSATLRACVRHKVQRGSGLGARLQVAPAM